MSTAAMTSSTPDLVRVGVANGERISDLVLPSRLPLAEILPEVAAATGALDPYEVHGGYRIVTASGRALDPEVSLLAQGVHDGAVLSLVAGVDLVEHKVYDDVVEAVADAVEDTGSGWTPQASRRTVLAVAGLLLALGALVLLLQPPTVTVGVVAGAAVLLLLLGCAVFARRLDDQAAAVITGVGASVFAVIGALAAARAVSFAVPLLASGVALLFTGIVATALLPRRGWTFMPAVVLGACGAVLGSILLATSLPPARVVAVVVVAAVAAASLVPWFALASARTLPEPFTSEAEILATPDPIDPERVRRGIGLAHDIQLGLSIAVALLVILAGPTLVTLGWAGLGLVWACGLVQMMRTRQFLLGRDVVVGLLGGTFAVAVGTIVGVLQHPEWGGIVGLIVAVLSVAVLASLAMPKRTTVRWGRLLDIIEGVALFALVPLLVVAVGLLGSRG